MRPRVGCIYFLFFRSGSRPLKTGRRDANQGRASQNRKCALSRPISNDLTRVRGSLTLMESYEDTHIDANSLVRDNRKWLGVRLDAFRGAFFCWAFLHGENVSARWQRDAIVSRLVCSQPRDLSFPVLSQDDQRVLGITFWRRLRHVIRFNRPDHDNLQMPLHETLRRSLNRCSADQH